MSQRGWRPPPSRSGPPFVLIGVLLAIIGVLLVGIILVLNGPGGTASASPSPTASELAGASIAPSGTPETSVVVPTDENPAEPTVEPPAEPTPATSLAPGATPRPALTAFAGPHTASCTDTNGTPTAGYIHLSWTATNTTGVRLSIDPPAANTAYGYGYADYPAVGSADVPFTCGPPNTDATGPYHLYVVTTAHTTGYFQYRFIKVYLKP